MRSFSLPVRRPGAKQSTRGYAWSSADIRRLRELADAGVAAEVIAARLRRTHSAVRNKATLHGIPLRSP